MTSPPPPPDLAPPGAGLPPLELFLGRCIFCLKRRLARRSSTDRVLEEERAAILALVASVPPSRRGRPVLVPRLRGLEDSSRYWSVWMVLEHLRITNEAFAAVIASLAAGRVPPGKASTAAVKPGNDVGEEVEAAFDAGLDRLRETVSGIVDLKTEAKYAHPWFGPLDAVGWHVLSATHLGIHRAQLAAILRLGEDRSGAFP